MTPKQLEQNQDYLVQGKNILHVIRNLRQARWELKNGFPMSCDLYLDYCLGVLRGMNPND